ncbi:MAG: Mur ligase family protein [Pseudomonadota bacterium]|nr:Mur ligase family protein [Pseudomonadota bacterium]
MTSNNTTPGRVHLIGICGTAMAALACMLQQLGWLVSGSDRGNYPPMNGVLAQHHIGIMAGYEAERITSDLQLVVVGNVAARENPEVQKALSLGLNCRSLPEILWSEFLREASVRVVVAGTHGKTTTSALAAWVLQAAGLEPSFLIGGLVNDFSANFQLGSESLFVLEGDEYNAAFFDRRAKFHHYHPSHLLLTGLEMDHADIFHDIKEIEAEFQQLISGMPRDGIIIAAADSRRLSRLLQDSPCPVVTYGTVASADYQLVGFEPGETGSRLTVREDDNRSFTLSTATIGRHNAENVLAVYLLARQLGVAREMIEKALTTFSGIKRRQEIISRSAKTIYISDFAHHPTAIDKTLQALAEHYPKRKLLAVFEPRTATSRQALFQDELAAAFRAADEVIIAPVYRGETLGEDQRLDTARLAADISVRGIPAVAAVDVEDIFARITSRSKELRLVAIMSTGDFGGLFDRIQEL